MKRKINEVFPTAPSPKSNTFRICLISLRLGKPLSPKCHGFFVENIPVKGSNLELLQKVFLVIFKMTKTIINKKKIMTFAKAFDMVLEMRKIMPKATVGFEIYPSNTIGFFVRDVLGIKELWKR